MKVNYEKIKEIFSFIKKHSIKILTIANLIFLAINIFFLLYKLRINVAMNQTQSQSIFLHTQNVNNNQNVNLNIMLNNYYQSSRLISLHKELDKSQIINFIKSLSYYQQIGLSLFKIDDKYVVVYPEITTNIISEPITYTNYQTNCNTSYITNKTWFNIFK